VAPGDVFGTDDIENIICKSAWIVAASVASNGPDNVNVFTSRCLEISSHC
jgi:hypothetical protein